MKKPALGLRLLELRQSHNLTQKQLCENLNIGRSTYSYFETGSRLPDIETLVMFANYYDISVDQLLGLSNDPAGSSKSVVTDDDNMQHQLLFHLRSKHIPPEFVLQLSKADYDFLKTICFSHRIIKQNYNI